MDYEFIVYGKETCGLCKNRIIFLTNFIAKHSISANIIYKNIETPEDLSDFICFNTFNNYNISIDEIPVVVLKKGEYILKTWSGHTKEGVPTTPVILSLIGKE